MKRNKTAFTLVELLTVLAVMSLLIGILIPSLKMAQDAARTAKQKMHLASIDQALFAFRNDYGEYPKSELTISPNGSYCGAQKLAEALLGLDLLGCDKRTNWDGDLALYTGAGSDLTKRMPRYLEIETANVFSVGYRNIPGDGLYENPAMLLPETYVLCDIFNWNSVEMGGKQVKAGLPILYYRADPSKVGFSQNSQTSIYNFTDNFFLIREQQMKDAATNPDRIHPLGPNGPVPGGLYFYNENYKIFDKKVAQATGGKPWPHRPDSYILISAGVDGLYGTNDDIVNFEY